jgi:ribose 5-phosphate isomerase B
MKIALGADGPYPILKTIYRLLEEEGHTIQLCSPSCLNEANSCLSWPQVGLAVAKVVSQKLCDEGIVLCWSGTGVCIAANKVQGIRAALCTDSPTAQAARIWNHANVLALSSRLLSEDLAKEILHSWFSPVDGTKGAKDLAYLEAFERV